MLMTPNWGLRIQIKIMTTGTSGMAHGIIIIPRATGRKRKGRLKSSAVNRPAPIATRMTSPVKISVVCITFQNAWIAEHALVVVQPDPDRRLVGGQFDALETADDALQQWDRRSAHLHRA